jgi:hypothetical protein
MHPTLLFYSMGINFGFALWKNYICIVYSIYYWYDPTLLFYSI